MDNLTKLKNLMVAACDSIKQGNRDIGLNLLEVAADVMEDITPEDIELQFVTTQVEAPVVEQSSFDEDDTLEDEVYEAASHKNLHDILSGWDALKNVGTV